MLPLVNIHYPTTFSRPLILVLSGHLIITDERLRTDFLTSEWNLGWVLTRINKARIVRIVRTVGVLFCAADGNLVPTTGHK